MTCAKIIPVPLRVWLYSFCLVSFSLAVLAGSAQAATGVDITGTVSLPPGIPAPPGGFDVIVEATDPGNLNYYYTTVVTITAGTNSITYTLPVPDDPSATWVVGYICPADFFVDRGYFSTSGTTYDQILATPLPGGTSIGNINMVILSGGTINGSVSLPAGATAPPGGMTLQVHARDVNGTGWYSTDVTIQAGQSSVTYVKTVHDGASSSWVVGYSCQQGCAGYVEEGFYTSTGTTWNRNMAEGLSGGGQNHPGVDLTLLPGKTMGGTLSLPAGDTAPKGGIPVLMNIENKDGTGMLSKFFNLSQGQASIHYALTVPDLAAASWLVSYSYGGDLYYYEGYYAATGTVCCQSDADLLPGGLAYPQLDMTLLPYWTVTASWFGLGAISPSGQVRVADHARRTFRLLGHFDRDYKAVPTSVTVEGTCPEGTLVDNLDNSWIYTTGVIVADCKLEFLFSPVASFDLDLFMPAILAKKKH